VPARRARVSAGVVPSRRVTFAPPAATPAVHEGRAEDEGYGTWLNIPSKVAQVAAVRAVARERRSADLAEDKLIMAHTAPAELALREADLLCLQDRVPEGDDRGAVGQDHLPAEGPGDATHNSYPVATSGADLAVGGRRPSSAVCRIGST
jgi:hypothetical protein